MKIVNFDRLIRGGGTKRRRSRHGKLFPDCVRCIIAGPSGSGKTNVLFNILFNREGVRFENIFVFSRSLFQPKYKYLERVIGGMDGVGYFAFSCNDDLLPLEDVPENSVVIFDDVVCEKQDNIARYFSMGRHKNVDIFYLTQTYTAVPKQLVRDNVNFLILLRQDLLNLQLVFRDHVAPDMTFNEFTDLCGGAWEGERRGFLTIDKERARNSGRYRTGI
jgi:hypothetical protein